MMRSTFRFLPAVSTFFLAALLGPARAWAVPAEALAPGTASGTYTLDGKAVPLHYAYAMAQPNRIDDKKTDTAILLTEAPIPEEVFEVLVDLKDAAAGRTHWVFLQFDQDGRPNREVVRDETQGDDLQSAGKTHSDFTLGSRTKERIEGLLQTRKEEEFLKHTYATQVRFHATIREAALLPDAKSGTKLPAGGGEPGKAYHEFFRQDTIEDGYVKGNIAVLYVTARGQYGTVRMSRIEGVWKIGPRKWSDHPPRK